MRRQILAVVLVSAVVLAVAAVLVKTPAPEPIATRPADPPATSAVAKPVVVPPAAALTADPAPAPVATLAPAPSSSPSSPVATPAADAGVRVLLTPLQETTLASPVTAKITRFDVSLGSTFVAGQTLIEFDCAEPVARVNMAQAELAGAVETHEAKVRMQGLSQASDVEVALAASAVAKARAQKSLHESQVKQCFVTAPWAGRVSKVHVRQHMSVTPGQPMVDLVMAGPLKLRLNVPSGALARLRQAPVFEVKIDETGQTYQARVTAVNSRIDAVSQTIEVEAMMAASYPGLLPGMSGTANIAALR